MEEQKVDYVKKLMEKFGLSYEDIKTLTGVNLEKLSIDSVVKNYDKDNFDLVVNEGDTSFGKVNYVDREEVFDSFKTFFCLYAGICKLFNEYSNSLNNEKEFLSKNKDVLLKTIDFTKKYYKDNLSTKLLVNDERNLESINYATVISNKCEDINGKLDLLTKSSGSEILDKKPEIKNTSVTRNESLIAEIDRETANDEENNILSFLGEDD